MKNTMKSMSSKPPGQKRKQKKAEFDKNLSSGVYTKYKKSVPAKSKDTTLVYKEGPKVNYGGTIRSAVKASPYGRAKTVRKVAESTGKTKKYVRDTVPTKGRTFVKKVTKALKSGKAFSGTVPGYDNQACDGKKKGCKSVSKRTMK
jgi:hypothetical protein